MGNLNSQRPPNPPLKVNFFLFSSDFVDVIHTNAGVYGKLESCGHIDFYMNNGQFQVKCSKPWKHWWNKSFDVHLPTIFQTFFCSRHVRRQKVWQKRIVAQVQLVSKLKLFKSHSYCAIPLKFSFCFADENLCSHMMALGNFITATIVIWVWQIVWSIFIGHMRRRLNHIFSIRSMH